METKFYSFNTTWANKWFFGRVSEEDISTVDRWIIEKAMRGFKGVVHVEITRGTTPADILCIDFPLMIVTSKLLRIWKQFEKYETYPVIIKNRKLLVEYTGVTFLGRGGPFDPVRSKAVYLKNQGNSKKPAIMNMDGLYFDESQWDGSDLFTIDEFPCHPIITEKVVEEMKKEQITNCKYTPLEEYCFYKKQCISL